MVKKKRKEKSLGYIEQLIYSTKHRTKRSTDTPFNVGSLLFLRAETKMLKECQSLDQKMGKVTIKRKSYWDNQVLEIQCRARLYEEFIEL